MDRTIITLHDCELPVDLHLEVEVDEEGYAHPVNVIGHTVEMPFDEIEFSVDDMDAIQEAVEDGESWTTIEDEDIEEEMADDEEEVREFAILESRMDDDELIAMFRLPDGSVAIDEYGTPIPAEDLEGYQLLDDDGVPLED